MSDDPLPQSEIILYQTEDGRTRVQYGGQGVADMRRGVVGTGQGAKRLLHVQADERWLVIAR